MVICSRCGKRFHAVEWVLTGQAMCPSCGHIVDIASGEWRPAGREDASAGDQPIALEDSVRTADEFDDERDENG